MNGVNLAVHHNIARLNEVLREYSAALGKTPEQVVRKASRDFAFRASAELKKIAPAAGSIRATMLGKLKGRSGGIHIRASVREALQKKYNVVDLQGGGGAFLRQNKRIRGLRGLQVIGELEKSIRRSRGKGQGFKRLNLTALMAEREINVREKARGYLAYVALLQGLEKMNPGERRQWFGRAKARQEVASAEFTASQDGNMARATMEINLGSAEAPSAAEGMAKTKAQGALTGAVAAMIADKRQYLEERAAALARPLEALR